ncbi:hypothetical protein QMP26_00565 [Enterocloster clostridioformis]
MIEQQQRLVAVPVYLMHPGETVRKLRLLNPFVAKGLPSPQGMKFSIKPFEH